MSDERSNKYNINQIVYYLSDVPEICKFKVDKIILAKEDIYYEHSGFRFREETLFSTTEALKAHIKEKLDIE